MFHCFLLILIHFVLIVNDFVFHTLVMCTTLAVCLSSLPASCSVTDVLFLRGLPLSLGAENKNKMSLALPFVLSHYAVNIYIEDAYTKQVLLHLLS